MDQNPYFHQNQLKINKNPKINAPSTITIPESAMFEGQNDATCICDSDGQILSAGPQLASLLKSQSVLVGTNLGDFVANASEGPDWSIRPAVKEIPAVKPLNSRPY